MSEKFDAWWESEGRAYYLSRDYTGHDLARMAFGAALASAPQASQPPQGALQGGLSNNELRAALRAKLPNGAYPEDQWLTPFALGVEVGAALAAPPQGASSLLPGWKLTDDEFDRLCAEFDIFGDYGRLRDFADELAALAASPLPAHQEPARFLLVAMDDDGCGNPFFCTDEKAVRAALAPLLFFFNDEHPLDAEQEASIDAQLECLLEDGFLNFEGDPGITLYKLHPPLYAAPAPVDEPREQGR